MSGSNPHIQSKLSITKVKALLVLAKSGWAQISDSGPTHILKNKVETRPKAGRARLGPGPLVPWRTTDVPNQ